jgi:hypothetical protein
MPFRENSSQYKDSNEERNAIVSIAESMGSGFEIREISIREPLRMITLGGMRI